MSFQPKFIYFDLDDTLLDHKQAERCALHDIYRHFGLFDTISSVQLIEMYQRVNSEQWLKYSRAEVSRQELQRNRFELTLRNLGLEDYRYEEIGSKYMQFYRSHWMWIDGAEQTFKELKRSYSVGILTNGFTETQKLKFEQFSLYETANYLVISEEVGALKPHPSVFEYATNLTGYDPDEILYIGDSYSSDVIGGTEFGWKVAWYTNNSETEKHQKADFIFSDFDELKMLLKANCPKF